jgi:hypothetical protein
MTWFTAERLFILACVAVWLLILVACEIVARRRSRTHDQAVHDLSTIHHHQQAARSLDRARRCHPSQGTHHP